MAQESWNVDASDGSGCQQQDGLVLCANNCGFFGCSATMNLCSNCFHELTSNDLEKGNLPSLSPDQSSAIASVSSSVVEESMVSSLSEKSLVSTSQSSSFDKSVDESLMVSILKARESSSSAVTSALESRSEEVSGRETVDDTASPDPSEPRRKKVLIQYQASALKSKPDFNSASEVGALSQENLLKSDLGLIASLFSRSEESADFPSSSSRKQVVNRCFTCRKRTGLLGFKCRCGDVFCGSHRHSVKHDCPYDYKSAAREAIAKANPIIKAIKVNKI